MRSAHAHAISSVGWFISLQNRARREGARKETSHSHHRRKRETFGNRMKFFERESLVGSGKFRVGAEKNNEEKLLERGGKRESNQCAFDLTRTEYERRVREVVGDSLAVLLNWNWRDREAYRPVQRTELWSTYELKHWDCSNHRQRET